MPLPGELLRVTSKVGSRGRRFYYNFAQTEWPKHEDEDQNPHQDRKETLTEMKAATKWHDDSKEFHAASVHEDKEDNPFFCHLLQSCSTFNKIRRVLSYVHRFVDIARRTAVPNSSLTVQDLKRSEFKLLKWSQLHLDVSQLDEKLIATTNEEGLIRTHGRLENSRKLRLKESYGRTKANALDYWAQENGQVRGKQVCRLSETAQETPTTAYGSTAKFAGSRRISSILEHSYGHVCATAVQTEPKNTPRRPGSNFHMRNNAIGSPGTHN